MNAAAKPILTADVLIDLNVAFDAFGLIVRYHSITRAFDDTDNGRGALEMYLLKGDAKRGGVGWDVLEYLATAYQL